MKFHRSTRGWRLIIGVALVLALVTGCSSIGRKLLFHPSHHPASGELAPWLKDGELIGYSRQVSHPKNIWLMLYGNAGQASDRQYAMQHFSPEDSVFIMEYPGFGQRGGKPTKDSFNESAKAAYLTLRDAFRQNPVCVVSESVGSGPACFLATLPAPPDKLVLIVPFERLSLVARDHFPSFIVALLLRDDWNNIESLAEYNGPVEIFGARSDTVIPIRHAETLAKAAPQARLVVIKGGIMNGRTRTR